MKFDLEDHIHQQKEFSLNTFGPGKRTQGILNHIKKELSEIEADPNDLEEWIDVILLAIDGAWRHGHSSEDIVNKIKFKFEKNQNRKWPDWKTLSDGIAIEHVKE